MVKIKKFYEIKHIVKTRYEDKFKKKKYELEKKEIEDKLSKELSNLFRELLLREIDKKGMKRYTALLNKNEISIEEIRKEIINSQEYFDRIETGVENIPEQKIQESKERVSNLFIEILHREADKEGLRTYALSLASGKMTEEEIRDEMMKSEESEFTKYKQVDNIPELERIQYEKIINKIYQEKLLRKADVMGLVRYTLFLSNGKMTEEEVRREVSASPEAIDIAIFIAKEEGQCK